MINNQSFGTRNAVCFTLNNYTDQEVLDLKGNDKITYLIFGYEIGENGTSHLQGYMETDRRYSLKVFKKIMARAHYERRYGTAEQARDYCKKGNQSKQEWDSEGTLGPNYGKDANVVEQGEIRVDKKGKRNDLSEMKDLIMVQHGNMVQAIDLASNFQSLRSAQIMLIYRPFKSLDQVKNVVWYYGPTGTGKTRSSMDEIVKDGRDFWISNDTLQWFDGYHGQPNVLIDDFRTTMCKYNFLLRLLDRYPLRVPVKGGFVEWEPENIWITSHKSPEDIYTYDDKLRDDITQLYRRIKTVRNYTTQGVVDIMYNI